MRDTQKKKKNYQKKEKKMKRESNKLFCMEKYVQNGKENINFIVRG